MSPGDSDRQFKRCTLSYIDTGKIETESPATCNALSSKLINDIGVVRIHILAPTDPHNSFHLTYTSGGIPKLLCNYFRAYKHVNVSIESTHVEELESYLP